MSARSFSSCAAVAIALAKPYTSCTRKGPQVTRGPQAAVLVIDDSFAAGYLVGRARSPLRPG